MGEPRALWRAEIAAIAAQAVRDGDVRAARDALITVSRRYPYTLEEAARELERLTAAAIDAEAGTV